MTPTNAQRGHTRLNTYVEAELAAWVQAQARRQDRTVSAWLRYVLLNLRQNMAHDPALGAILQGSVRGSDDSA